MIMGMLILRQSYSLTKYISVAMVTVGIYICTYVSATQKEKNDEKGDVDSLYLLVGV
jgi:UDP-xylose/UDP-N-acetylglucosamine transporter B4